MKPNLSTGIINYFGFNSYFNSYILPNDILLLYSFSSEFYKFKRCSTHSIDELILSKIIFIDLNNFNEISSTETFRDLLQYILLENIICI